MTDYVLPPSIPPAEVQWTLKDFTGIQQSPFSGAVRTISRGQRWAATFRWANVAGADRAALAALAASLRGASNRIWITDPSYQQQGSFPGGELFTNANFANGITGWSGSTLSARKGIMRATSPGGGIYAEVYQSVPVTQYMPLALRSLILDGAQTAGHLVGRAISDGIVQSQDYSAARGLGTISCVALSAQNQFPAVLADLAGYTAGAYILIPYVSAQRCALVDNAPNWLLQSNTFGTAPWNLTNATVGATAVVAPDASYTVPSLIENATTGSHSVYQSITVAAAAADFTCSVWVTPGTRNWFYISLTESTGNTVSFCYFNASTGAVGTGGNGANWTNLRTTVVNAGGGWYRFTLTARKTSAGTAVTLTIGAASADNTGSYTGVASAIAIYPWHASLAQSGVPVRDQITTTTPYYSGATNPAGSACNVRGLPASTNGLLLAGDMCDINGELKRATADLNSDASGLGYLQFEPALRSASTPDGAPIVIGAPMGKFVLAAEVVQMSRPGYFSDFELQLIEA